MKRLLLLRHAKAESSGKGGSTDFDRVLTGRGRRDAEAIGRVIAERGERFDRVLCSSSARTRETWHEVGAALADAPEPDYLRAIYEAQASYLDILRAHGGEADAVLLVGHNPTIQETAVSLAGQQAGPDAAALKAQFPTASLAIFEFDGGWAEIAPGGAKLTAFVRLRDGEEA